MSWEVLGFLAMVVFLAASAIICAEIYDQRDEERQKRAIDERIRCSGRICSIERKGILEWRNAYHWRVRIAFEFEGGSYTLEHRAISKPLRAVGDSVIVFVDRENPWKSEAAI